jgi:hypothetical protein
MAAFSSGNFSSNSSSDIALFALSLFTFIASIPFTWDTINIKNKKLKE